MFSVVVTLPIQKFPSCLIRLIFPNFLNHPNYQMINFPVIFPNFDQTFLLLPFKGPETIIKFNLLGPRSLLQRGPGGPSDIHSPIKGFSVHSSQICINNHPETKLEMQVKKKGGINLSLKLLQTSRVLIFPCRGIITIFQSSAKYLEFISLLTLPHVIILLRP